MRSDTGELGLQADDAHLIQGDLHAREALLSLSLGLLQILGHHPPAHRRPSMRGTTQDCIRLCGKTCTSWMVTRRVDG